MLLCYILFSSSFPPTSFELFSRPNFVFFLLVNTRILPYYASYFTTISIKSPAFYGLDLEQDP